MTKHWFARKGWVHYPAGWQGWLVVAAGAMFLVNVFVAVDRHSHSVSDTLYGIFPYWALTFLLIEWVASRTCAGSNP